MNEQEKNRLIDLFSNKKEVFCDDIGSTAFCIAYWDEIMELAKRFQITLCLHNPKKSLAV